MTRASAFDLSSKTGIATWDGESDKPVLSPKAIIDWDLGGGIMLERWRLFLSKHFTDHRPDVVAAEAPSMGAHGDQTTIFKQAALRGMLQWACHVKRVRYFEIPIGTWRKSFIGFGARGKRAKIDVDWKRLAKQRCDVLGWDHHGDHNCAEAGGVLHHLLAGELDLDVPWRDFDSLKLPLTEICHANRRG